MRGKYKMSRGSAKQTPPTQHSVSRSESFPEPGFRLPPMNIQSPLRVFRFAIAADRVDQTNVVIEWLASDDETNAIIAYAKSLSK
jgi:hypothetical protein